MVIAAITLERGGLQQARLPTCSWRAGIGLHLQPTNATLAASATLPGSRSLPPRRISVAAHRQQCRASAQRAQRGDEIADERLDQAGVFDVLVTLTAPLVTSAASRSFGHIRSAIWTGSCRGLSGCSMAIEMRGGGPHQSGDPGAAAASDQPSTEFQLGCWCVAHGRDHAASRAACLSSQDTISGSRCSRQSAHQRRRLSPFGPRSCRHRASADRSAPRSAR